jgi:mannosyltransferase OCH1-like enzyme
MIPKVIHQIWLGDQSRRPSKLMETWKTLNPDWEHKIWTEENMPELQCQPQFDAMAELAGKADILRYEILFNEGGFYIDADAECTKPLDDFFLDNDSFCCWENEYTRTGLMANGYLGAIKGNALMGLMINTIKQIPIQVMKDFPPLTAWQTVGPSLLTKMIQHHTYHKIEVYPSHYFIPLHYTGVDQSYKKQIYGKQYYMSTPISGNSYDDFKD